MKEKEQLDMGKIKDMTNEVRTSMLQEERSEIRASEAKLYYNYKDTYGDIIEIEADTYEQAYEQAYDRWIDDLMDTYYGDIPLMACTDITILGLDLNLEDEDGNPKIISVFNEVLTIDNR